MFTKEQRHTEALSKVFDTTSTSGYTYIGYAYPGTATSAGKWQIEKVKNDGTVQSKFPVDGSSNASTDYLYVWDDRTSLTYA